MTNLFKEFVLVKSMKTKLLLDTNFLIYLAKYGMFELLREQHADLLVIESVITELKKLSSKGADKANAMIALEIINRWKIPVIDMDIRDTDKGILKAASDLKNNGENAMVGTMDRGLSEKLEKAGIKILRIRQKKHFIEG